MFGDQALQKNSIPFKMKKICGNAQKKNDIKYQKSTFIDYIF